MKTGDQADPGANKNAAQHERTDNSPKQNAMLLLVRNSEKIKDQQKNKKVVNAEGNFQNVAGNELQGNLLPLPETQNNCESAGQHHIHRAPAKGGAKPDNASTPVEAQVHQ